MSSKNHSYLNISNTISTYDTVEDIILIQLDILLAIYINYIIIYIYVIETKYYNIYIYNYIYI